MSEDIDIDELNDRIDALEAAVADLREYGDEHGIPAIERNAKRIEDNTRIIRQNVPGALPDDE